MYAVTATVVVTETDGEGKSWQATKQIPTFYLDENVQGIVDEAHAEKIAREILTACVNEEYTTYSLSVCAVRLS